MGAVAAIVVALVAVNTIFIVDIVVVVDDNLPSHLPSRLLRHLSITSVLPCGETLCQGGHVHGALDHIEVAGGTGSVDRVEERPDAGVII